MAKKASPYQRELRRALRALLPVASTNAELRKRAGFPARTKEPYFGFDVTFVSRARMKTLNRKYRGKAYPTDVLSFPALEVFARQGHLGDVVICEPVLERQAKEAGHSPIEELHVLLIHGLLHLLGYDHEKSRREAAEMAKWEGRLLKVMNLHVRAKGLIQRESGPRVRSKIGGVKARPAVPRALAAKRAKKPSRSRRARS